MLPVGAGEYKDDSGKNSENEERALQVEEAG